MIRAASLFYALVVSLLLGALLSGIIMSTHMRSMRTERWLAFNQARDNVYSAMVGPFQPAASLYPVHDSLDLFGQGDDPVSIDRAAWGLFDLRTCIARKADQRSSRSALLGHQCSTSSPSLYIADHGEPIALAGEVSLHGTCFLPASGLRRAYIEGRPYQGSLTIPDQRPSEHEVPALDEGILARIELFTGLIKTDDIERVPWTSLPKDSISVAFTDKLLTVDLGRERTLEDANVSGHIVLVAHDSLRIAASFRCTGIVICAPYISIDSAFAGDLQCFATGGIIVGPNSKLNYPSVLACLGDQADKPCSITLGTGTGFEGTIIGSTKGGAGGRTMTVELGNEVRYTGEIWTDGAVQLHGTITGTVVAGSTVLRTPSSVYRGHIMDAIVAPMDDPQFVGAGVWRGASGGAVLEWVDQLDRPHAN